jgi:protein-S-isoprenylcysteine O-methyltransferase Ste14
VPALGPRGEGWVIVQFLVFGAIAACGFLGTDWSGGTERSLQVVGLALEAGGVLLGALGIRALGSSFTPLPRPRGHAGLRGDGIYRLVRHPIYGGVIVLAVGWSLYSSPLALVPTAVLIAVFELKSRREEAWLTERYPEYTDYRAATRRRFIPWVI